MPAASLASGHAERSFPGDAGKTLINLYVESNPSDPMRPVEYRKTPGSRDADTGNVLQSTPRGVDQADGHAGGKVLVLDGSTVRSYTPSGDVWAALTGTVAGTDRAQWAFGEVQGALLANGQLYVSTGSAVAAASDADWATLLSDHGETAFTSVESMGQRVLLTYGNRFAFSDALQFNTTTVLSYYTAESSPDALVCGARLGSIYYLMGTQTIEPWFETGNNDDPFSPQVGAVINVGCLCRDSVVRLDNALFFIASDYTVRRLVPGGAQIINAQDQWISNALRGVDPADILCKALHDGAHGFYIINAPDFCVAFDLLTGTWHKRQTFNADGYEWAHVVEVGAQVFAGSRTGARFAELSHDYLSDYQASASAFGTHIARVFTAHLSNISARMPISTIRLDGPKGIGKATGAYTDPLVTMEISHDKGNTFGNPRQRALGKIGRYSERVIWRRNGRARPEQTVLRFRCTDPVEFGATLIAVNED